MIESHKQVFQPVNTNSEDLKSIARQLRLDVIDMTTRYAGHPSSCFSATEILTALFFGGILRYRPQEPHWPERDRCILSKGHAAPLLYAVLAHAGYFNVDELQKFRLIDSGLHGHPIQDSMPGVEFTSGSLGQGLSFGLGHVLAGRLGGLEYRVYVVMGDGECEEGQVWEAAMAAAHYKADHLVAIIDHNKYQQTGPISREMSLSPFVSKWQSFGWNVQEVDGHETPALVSALRATWEVAGSPSAIIAHTVKGKGVSFVEKDYTYHGRPLTIDQAKEAREEILCS